MSTRPETLAPPAAPRGSAGASPARGPARTGGSGLTKRWHGMPVWVWLVGAGVGGYLLWTRVLHKSTSTPAAPAATTPAPATQVTPIVVSPGTGGGGGVTGVKTSGGRPLGTTPGTNQLIPRRTTPAPTKTGTSHTTATATKATGPTTTKAEATANAAVKRANADAAATAARANAAVTHSNQDAAAAAARANAAVARANQDAAAAAKRAQASIAHSNALARAAQQRAQAYHVVTKTVASTGKKTPSPTLPVTRHFVTSATGRIHRRRG